jgi:integrase/recombinase XerC
MKKEPQPNLDLIPSNLFNLKPYDGFLSLCKSSHTKENYNQDLRVLKQFIDKLNLKSPTEATPEHMVKFAGSLAIPGVTPTGKTREAYATRTIKRILASTRSFYRYLASIQHIATDPTAVFHNLAIRSPQRNPHPLVPGDRESLVKNLKTYDLESQKISLVVLFGYHCGLRVSEIAHIRIRDIDLSQKLVTVIGKGDKERTIPMTPVVANLLLLYLKNRPDPSCPYLFSSPRSSNLPIHPDYLETWVKKAAHWANLDHADELTVHVLRHSFGTQLAEAGASVYEIRDLMGHSSIMVSENYVKLASTKAIKAHQKAFPTTWTAMALQLQATDGPGDVLKKIRQLKDLKN